MKSTVPLVHWCIGDFQVAGRLTPLRRSYTIRGVKRGFLYWKHGPGPTFLLTLPFSFVLLVYRLSRTTSSAVLAVPDYWQIHMERELINAYQSGNWNEGQDPT